MYRSAQNITHKQKNAEVSKVDYFTFLEKRSEAFRFSTLHSWKVTPPTAQLAVFMFQVLFHYATNSNTPFVVAAPTFSELRDRTEDELEAILVHLQKQFIVEFLDGKGILFQA